MHFLTSRQGDVPGSRSEGEPGASREWWVWVGVLTLALWGYVTSLNGFTSLGLSFPFYKLGIRRSTF